MVLDEYLERLIGIAGLIILLLVSVLVFILLVRKDSVVRIKKIFGIQTEEVIAPVEEQIVTEKETNIEVEEAKGWLSRLKRRKISPMNRKLKKEYH